MYLHDYLLKNKISRKDFAASIKYTSQSLYNYFNKKRRPTEGFCALVESATNGEVTKKEVLDFYYKDVYTQAKPATEKNECSQSSQTFFCKECMKKLLIIAANS